MSKSFFLFLFLTNHLLFLVLVPEKFKNPPKERRLEVDRYLGLLAKSLDDITEKCQELKDEKSEFEKSLNNNLDLMLNEARELEPSLNENQEENENE
jgi:hypothetical protein